MLEKVWSSLGTLCNQRERQWFFQYAPYANIGYWYSLSQGQGILVLHVFPSWECLQQGYLCFTWSQTHQTRSYGPDNHFLHGGGPHEKTWHEGIETSGLNFFPEDLVRKTRKPHINPMWLHRSHHNDSLENHLPSSLLYLFMPSPGRPHQEDTTVWNTECI